VTIKPSIAFLAVALLGGTIMLAPTAKDDIKDAGKDIKQAGKETGHAAKQTGSATKKTVKKGVNKTAEKVVDGARAVERKTN